MKLMEKREKMKMRVWFWFFKSWSVVLDASTPVRLKSSIFSLDVIKGIFLARSRFTCIHFQRDIPRNADRHRSTRTATVNTRVLFMMFP